jgi:tRNA G10  N-methylase Trm11
MRYFFILGSNPTLSLAEIYSLLGAKPEYNLIGKDCLLLETDGLNAKVLINQLGGTVKIGKIVAAAAPADLLATVKSVCQPDSGHKFFFGFSTYGKVGAIKALAMQLKKLWQAEGINSRWVTSRDKNLSSAAVEQSGLLAHGQEIVLIRDGAKILVGLTEVVQPFKDWSRRDYGRPERDDYTGMLPPKLARIMINLARPAKNDILLDPFCGSGTVLTEAALSGCRRLIGSDISLDALDASKSNLAWLQEKYQDLDFRCQLYQCDARRIYEILGEASVNRVVTEPYLGPARGRSRQQKVVKELTDLYNEFLKALAKILPPDGRAVMVWPVLLNGSQKLFLQPTLGRLAIARPLPDKLAFNLSSRQTIIYGRPGQKICREVVVLVKSD